jgi:hypothetical protein
MWQKVSELINQKIKKKGASSLLLSCLVCYQAMKISQGSFKPLSFQNGVLVILAPDPSTASSIRLSQSQIIAQINQALKQPVVQKVRVKIKG